jgi:pimeloyl-ACP methyl ester carboxylesterase
LLFLHGAAGLPRWNSFFELLAERFEVLLPQHPGFGSEQFASRIRNVADLAMYYLDFLDGLPGGPVHLVAHSLGGWAAAELATRNCSRLASMTLIAPAGLRVKGISSGDNFIWSAEELTRNLYHDQALADAVLSTAVTEEEADRQLTNRFMAARLAWEPRWYSPGLEHWLHRIRVPSLLIWGSDDRLLPSAYASAWEERLPGLQTRIIPNCGHLPHIEQPAETADCVLRFLGART